MGSFRNMYRGEHNEWLGANCDDLVATKEEAVEWVTANTGIVRKIIRSVAAYLAQDDVEELCHDAYVIALESLETAAAKGLRFQAVFSLNFKLHVRQSYYHDPTIADHSMLDDIASNQPSLDDVLDRERMERNLQTTCESTQAVLSPSEYRLFSLFVGDTQHGCCTFSEAMGILDMPAGQVSTLYRRVRTKLAEAGRMYDRDGRVTVFSWKKQAAKVRRATPRRAANRRSGAQRGGAVATCPAHVGRDRYAHVLHKVMSEVGRLTLAELVNGRERVQTRRTTQQALAGDQTFVSLNHAQLPPEWAGPIASDSHVGNGARRRGQRASRGYRRLPLQGNDAECQPHVSHSHTRCRSPVLRDRSSPCLKSYIFISDS